MKRALKILQVCFTDAWGGLEMSALDFTRHFQNSGHESYCLCKKGSRLEKELQDGALRYYAIDYFTRYSPLAILKIHRLIKKMEFDVVHLHTPRDLWLITPALTGLPKVKLFATTRMFFTRAKKQDFLHRYLYSRLTRLIHTTRISQDQMKKNLSVPDSKHMVIPNPVDLARFSPEQYSSAEYRQSLNISETDLVIGLVGRIDPSKGQREAIEAMPEVLADFPETKLLIVGEVTLGEHKNYDNTLKELARQLNVADNIIWTGFSSNIPQIMKSFDIFIMPSYQESFGKVLIEAMAMELACVSTTRGGPPEILDNGNCGLLVPAREAKPLAEAIKTLLADKNLRLDLGKKARQRVMESYSLKAVFAALEKAYFEA